MILENMYIVSDSYLSFRVIDPISVFISLVCLYSVYEGHSKSSKPLHKRGGLGK